jgi:signal transduction histidine kinase
MKKNILSPDVIRLIRVSSFLWIGYIIVLLVINQILWPQVPVRGDIFYCLLIGIVALICLGLSYWAWLQHKLGRAFIPIIIAIIIILPMAATWWIFKSFPPVPMLDPQGSVLLQLPFLLVAFLLVAWLYKLQHMLFIILGIIALNLATTLSFARPGPAPFQGVLNVTLIQTVVFLVVGFTISYLISRLKSQQQSLEEANIRLSHYASTLEKLATSRERNRLARELHDTIAHTISGLAVQLETVKAYWDVDAPTARSMLEKSLTATHSGLDETRRALKALRASTLEDLGLSLAISNMAKETTANTELSVELNIQDDIPALSPDIEQCVYRIAQESVNNAIKHAGAKHLNVGLEFREGKTTLRVKDDGIGFNPEKTDSDGGLGLLGIKERAALVGGKLTVISKPGQGTTIKLTI